MKPHGASFFVRILLETAVKLKSWISKVYLRRMHMKVAVVEAAETVRHEIVTLLNSCIPAAVWGYATGEEFLLELSRIHMDMAIINTVLPDINGLSLGKKARALRPGIKIVYMSSQGRHALAAFEQEADDFLLMPFEHSRLALMLERVRDFNLRGGEGSTQVGIRKGGVPGIES